MFENTSGDRNGVWELKKGLEGPKRSLGDRKGVRAFKNVSGDRNGVWGAKGGSGGFKQGSVGWKRGPGIKKRAWGLKRGLGLKRRVSRGQKGVWGVEKRSGHSKTRLGFEMRSWGIENRSGHSKTCLGSKWGPGFEVGNTTSADHPQVAAGIPVKNTCRSGTRGSGSPVGNGSSRLWITVFKISRVPAYLRVIRYLP